MIPVQDAALYPFQLFALLVISVVVVVVALAAAMVYLSRKDRAAIDRERSEHWKSASDLLQFREKECADLAKLALEIVGTQNSRMIEKLGPQGSAARPAPIPLADPRAVADGVRSSIAKRTGSLFPEEPSADQPFALHTFQTVPEPSRINPQYNGSSN